jgi:hypothetical protein
MTDDRGSETQYSEREMALILKRAADLEGREGEAAKSSARYTLAEIQEIAAGAGIDADTVTAAAAELRRPTHTPWLLGGPTRFRAERRAPVTVSSTAFGELVEIVRLQTSLQGDSTQVFDGLEWRGQDVGGAVFVTIAPRERETRVTVVAARGDEAVLAGGAGLGAAIATSVVVIPLLVSAGAPPFVVAVATAVAAATAFVATTRAIWRRRAGRWAQRTTEIADTITRRLTQLSGARQPAD